MIIGGHTITIERKLKAPLRDKRGNITFSTEDIIVSGVKVQYGGSSRTRAADGDEVSSDITLYFKRGTEIEESDVFVVDGERFMANGKPQLWKAPPSFSYIKTAVVINADRTEN